MADYPAMPVFTDAYLRDCWHLSDAEHGRYLLLLMLMWQTPSCRVPNDPKWIARHMRRTEEEYERDIAPLIKEFCKTTGNWITQKRLTREYDFLRKTSKTQSARAKSRWDKEKGSTGNGAKSKPEAVPQPSQNGAGAMPPTHTLPTPLRDKTLATQPYDPREPDAGLRLARLEFWLREAAGWQNETSPRLAVTGPIDALAQAGVSPELDIFPTVRAKAHEAHSRKSWDFFVDPIKRAYAKRTEAGSIAVNGTAPDAEARKAAARKVIEEHEAKFRAEQQANGNLGRH